MLLGRTLTLITIIAALLSISSNVQAEEIDLKALSIKAEQGSGNDSYKLGLIYEERGDYEAAEKWYRAGVFYENHLSALALYSLGESGKRKIENIELYKGLGLKTLQERATTYGSAAYELSQLYQTGLHLQKDKELAFKWLLKADAMGERKAALELGSIYLSGFYQTVDTARALSYFKRAYELGAIDAARPIALIYASGSYKNMDEALKYWRIAAENGDALSMRDIGNYYARSKGDKAEALKWYEKAAQAGEADSQYYLAMHYKNTNPTKAKALLKKAKTQEHFLSMVELEKSK
tara:strand:+ start:6145 stop:7026 length:882 start_codon:yes stop_codon:yes gene_type:complete